MVALASEFRGVERQSWIEHLVRLARPVLGALANERLRATMPVEQRSPANKREAVSHLEAFARLMAGLSPWLECGGGDPMCAEMTVLAQRALGHAVNPESADYLNFDQGSQPLVDGAFLAHAILRAPKVLWHGLEEATRRNLVRAMLATRVITPAPCNWLLFSASVEAFLAMAGERFDGMRVQYALRQHMQWYKGDSMYGDGAEFHWDYYNSYVIQPMLLDVLGEMRKHSGLWDDLADPILKRAQRHAMIQERLVAPDGSFPPIGRSLAYRCGAFQLLAQLALSGKLPAELPGAQVKTALSLVIDRTLGAAGTFDEAGWLRIGLCGHQPGLGETYISTGSLYLCSTAFLPLGLPAEDGFWKAPAERTSAQRIWSGENLEADHALHG